MRITLNHISIVADTSCYTKRKNKYIWK